MNTKVCRWTKALKVAFYERDGVCSRRHHIFNNKITVAILHTQLESTERTYAYLKFFCYLVYVLHVLTSFYINSVSHHQYSN